MKAIDDLAHQIRAFVAVEQAREGLDLKVSAGFDRTQYAIETQQHRIDVALDVFK